MSLLRRYPIIFVLLIIAVSFVDCKRKKEIVQKDIEPVASSRQVVSSQPPLDLEEMRRQRNLMRSANIAWIKQSTKKYSPDSWYLLMQYENLPGTATVNAVGNGVASARKEDETFRYLRGRNKLDMLSSMENNVHEISHAYFSHYAFRYMNDNKVEMDPAKAQGFVYVFPSEGYFLSYPLDAMFPSRELDNVIPKDLRTYRFDTYIRGITSTQSEGIIGLLNELHAYYLGSRYCFDMLEPYKIAAGSASAGLFEWVTYTQSTMSAFYEFDYYIMEYLLYMKGKYDSEYDLLRSYEPFTRTYRRLRELYARLIDDYLDRIRIEIKILNSSGKATARLEKGWLWVKAQKSNVASGTPVFSDPREKLMPILESRKYREVENDFGLR